MAAFFLAGLVDDVTPFENQMSLLAVLRSIDRTGLMLGCWLGCAAFSGDQIPFSNL